MPKDRKNKTKNDEKVKDDKAGAVPKTKQQKIPIKKPSKKFAFSPLHTIRSTSTTTHHLNNYNKDKILKSLKERGCSKAVHEKTLEHFHLPADVVTDYLNKHLVNAVNHVKDECESPLFNNIKAWLEKFTENDLDKHSKFELSYLMKYIGATEEFPNPDTVAGVDFRSIYEFYAKALMGMPQKELSKRTAQYMSYEYMKLIDELNTTENEEMLQYLHEHLTTADSSLHTSNSDKLSADILLFSVFQERKKMEIEQNLASFDIEDLLLEFQESEN